LKDFGEQTLLKALAQPGKSTKESEKLKLHNSASIFARELNRSTKLSEMALPSNVCGFSHQEAFGN
jgi:hypothetical protein